MTRASIPLSVTPLASGGVLVCAAGSHRVLGGRTRDGRVWLVSEAAHRAAEVRAAVETGEGRC